MSEKYETSIERLDKKLTAQIGRKAIVFSYNNTMIYEHPEVYSQFDHVYRVNDNGKTGVYYMRSKFPELYNALREENFPRLHRPYPTLQDEQVVMNLFVQEMDGELDKILGDEE